MLGVGETRFSVHCGERHQEFGGAAENLGQDPQAFAQGPGQAERGDPDVQSAGLRARLRRSPPLPPPKGIRGASGDTRRWRRRQPAALSSLPPPGLPRPTHATIPSRRPPRFKLHPPHLRARASEREARVALRKKTRPPRWAWPAPAKPSGREGGGWERASGEGREGGAGAGVGGGATGLAGRPGGVLARVRGGEISERRR